MKHFISFLGLVGTALVLCPQASADNILSFSYDDGSNEGMIWGTQKKENYDVAIRIDNPEFVGAEIVGLRAFVQNSDDVNSYSGFITTELAVENKLNVPNITSKEGVREGNWMTVDFDKPYKITDKGVYVGYSMAVSSIDTKAGQYPVAVVEGYNPNAMFVHSSRSYLKWKDLSEDTQCILSLEVLIRGDFVSDAVKVLEVSDINVKAGSSASTSVTIANVGVTPINTVGYTYTLNGETTEGTYAFESPIPARHGMSATFDIELPAIAELGCYPLQVSVNNVNGNANAEADNKTDAEYWVLSRIPVHNPYIEEFTGTWCGFCPRGYVAMELMNERHDDFVGAAYHNGDPMTIAGNKLDSGAGYPSSMVDRVVTCDPYFGLEEEGYDLGIEKLWESYKNIFTPFEIELKADFTDETRTAVKMEASVTSVKDIKGKEFRIEYVLIQDNMRGTTASWLQTNYYSNDETARPIEGMDMFIDAASHLFVPFNLVAVANTGNLGVEGSLPADIKLDETYTHSHTFVLDEQLNYTAQPIVTDPRGLRAIALVVELDGSPFGKIRNATKTTFPSLAGVTNVAGDMDGIVKYYDLSGMEVANPDRGMYIKVTTTIDGQRKAEKFLKK